MQTHHVRNGIEKAHAVRLATICAIIFFLGSVSSFRVAAGQDSTPNQAVADAQEIPTSQDAKAGNDVSGVHPLKPSDTSSFRATLQSFQKACEELYSLLENKQSSASFSDRVLPAAERIKDCLDLSGLPSELGDTVGVETGVYLKEVLDRIELPLEDQIPNTTNPYNPPPNRWEIPGTRIAINRIATGRDAGKYLFSADTVGRATKIYSMSKRLPYRGDENRLTPGFLERYVELTKQQPTLTSDTFSPRGTFTLFLSRTNEIHDIIRREEDFDRSETLYLPIVNQIFRCLDLSELPEYSRDYYAAEAAVCLKEVLDRIPLPVVEQIPGPEDVKPVDGSEPLAAWQIPDTKLVISRILDGPRRGEYLFSSATVQQAVVTYERIKKQPYRTEGPRVSAGLHEWYLSTPGDPTIAAWVDAAPSWFRKRWVGLAWWQWFGLMLGTIVSVLLMLVAYRLGGVQSERNRHKSLLRYWGNLAFPIAAMLVPLGFKHYAWETLTLRGSALYITEFTANLFFLAALIVVILGLGSRLADSVVALPRARSHEIDPTLIRILFRLLAIVAATIVFLEGGRYLGFPLTTLLASAGIGGLAIAFSAQGMIRGLFGTITLLLDRPFRVGDRIIAKGQDGFVEEVGLRSTKIREFLSGHLISIPNDQMADAEIENVGKRKHIHRLTDLRIPLDTPREKVQISVNVIREILQNHEGMDPDYPPRVFFNEFNQDSFNIRILYWYSPPDLWKHYEVSEKINLEIFRAFEDNGIQFSLPSRHSFWKHDDQQGPLDVRVFEESISQAIDFGSGSGSGSKKR